VVIANRTNNVYRTLYPDSISDSQVLVTIPPIEKGVYGVYLVKNGEIKSRKLPIVSVPRVIIRSVKKIDNTVLIEGSGFGYYDQLYKNVVNVTINSYDKKGNFIYRNVQINKWEDVSISLYTTDSGNGDTVKVNGIFGTASATIKENKGGGKK
jgi:hypothetical protein